MKKKSIQQLEKAFTIAEKQLETARKDLITIKTFISDIQEIARNIEELEQFYQSETWMQGYEELHVSLPDKIFESAGEDSIADVSQEFYFLKIKLLKQLTDSIYRIIPDYYHEILEKK